MLFGLYAAAAGMLARSQAQDVIAHNLANVGVPGFKSDVPVTESFGAALSRTLGPRPRQDAPRGASALNVRSVTDRRQGLLRETGNTADLAIEGAGFFLVDTPAGPRLTRAGAFHVNPQGELSTVEGHAVLNEQGAPIHPAADRWTVGSDGTVSVGSWAIGKLRIVLPDGPLTRDGHGFLHADGFHNAPANGFALRQGYLEGSTAEPIREMVTMIAGMRAYEMAQRVLSAQDESLGRLISEVGQP